MGHFNHSVTARKKLEAEFQSKKRGSTAFLEVKSDRKSEVKDATVEEKEEKQRLHGRKAPRCPAPKNDMPTRFSSTYFMLKELNEVAVYMNTVLVASAKESAQRLVLSPDVQKAIKEALMVIEPLHEASRVLSCEQQSKIGSVAPRFHRTKDQLEKLIPTLNCPSVIAGAKAVLKDLSEVRLPRASTPLHHIASALDPNEKELTFLQGEEEGKVKMKAAWETITRECRQVNIIQQKSLKQDASGSDEDYEAIPSESGTTLHGETVANEIKRYKAAPPRQKTSLLRWWNENKSSFPRVSQVARKYLSAMATSMPCERLFSTGGNIVTVKRTRLTDYHVSAQMFLKVNYHWIFGLPNNKK